MNSPIVKTLAVAFASIFFIFMFSLLGYSFYKMEADHEAYMSKLDRSFLIQMVYMNKQLTLKESRSIATCIVEHTDIDEARACYRNKIRPSLKGMTDYERLRYNILNNTRSMHWLPYYKREQAIDCMNNANDQTSLKLCAP